MSPPMTRLEDLPNIGTAIASDLRAIGIVTPEQLAKRDPLATYLALAKQMGHRHDPCALYTLLAVKEFLDHGDKLHWFKFAAQGKILLAAPATDNRE